MSRLLSLAIALLAPFIFGGWLITQGGLSATAETKTVNESVIPDMMEGNADASVTVVEYASFTCPHCASFHAGPYKKLKKNYIDTGKVKFIFREFPTPPQNVAIAGFALARCAGADNYYDVLDDLFANQTGILSAARQGAVIPALQAVGERHGINGEAAAKPQLLASEIKAVEGGVFQGE